MQTLRNQKTSHINYYVLHKHNKMKVPANFRWPTCGCAALKGGIPTRSSKRITPTDHQSAVAPTIRIMWDNQTIKTYVLSVNC